jgi:hypothetical protein
LLKNVSSTANYAARGGQDISHRQTSVREPRYKADSIVHRGGSKLTLFTNAHTRWPTASPSVATASRVTRARKCAPP